MERHQNIKLTCIKSAFQFHCPLSQRLVPFYSHETFQVSFLLIAHIIVQLGFVANARERQLTCMQRENKISNHELHRFSVIWSESISREHDTHKMNWCFDVSRAHEKILFILPTGILCHVACRLRMDLYGKTEMSCEMWQAERGNRKIFKFVCRRYRSSRLVEMLLKWHLRKFSRFLDWHKSRKSWNKIQDADDKLLTIALYAIWVIRLLRKYLQRCNCNRIAVIKGMKSK